jgi:DNA polymerase lambda
LTRHFELFTKQSERQKKLADISSISVLGKGKGKAKQIPVKDVAALGGKVFEGLRFCFPPELGNTSKQKTHWDIVSLPRRIARGGLMGKVSC